MILICLRKPKDYVSPWQWQLTWREIGTRLFFPRMRLVLLVTKRILFTRFFICNFVRAASACQWQKQAGLVDSNFADSDAPSRLRDIISAQGTVWSRKDTVSGWPCNQAGCLRQTAVWNTKALSLSLSLSLSLFTPHTHTHTHTHTVMTDSPRVPSSVPPAAMPVIRRPTPRSGAVTVEHDKQLSALKHQSVDLTAAWFGD